MSLTWKTKKQISQNTKAAYLQIVRKMSRVPEGKRIFCFMFEHFCSFNRTWKHRKQQSFVFSTKTSPWSCRNELKTKPAAQFSFSGSKLNFADSNVLLQISEQMNLISVSVMKSLFLLQLKVFWPKREKGSALDGLTAFGSPERRRRFRTGRRGAPLRRPEVTRSSGSLDLRLGPAGRGEKEGPSGSWVGRWSQKDSERLGTSGREGTMPFPPQFAATLTVKIVMEMRRTSAWRGQNLLQPEISLSAARKHSPSSFRPGLVKANPPWKQAAVC